jgi:hypothetical protein
MRAIELAHAHAAQAQCGNSGAVMAESAEFHGDGLMPEDEVG